MKRLLQLIDEPRKITGVIFLLACLLYANTISNNWAVDDGLVIHNSSSVRRGIAGIPGIFTGDFIESSTGRKLDAIAGNRYRPLTPALFATLASLTARPARDSAGNPARDQQGHVLKDLSESTPFPQLLHLLNTLLYAVLCTLLYRVMLLLLKDRRKAALLAFLTALLYTVHPLHTEAVANAKGLDEILATLFSLLSLRFAICAFDEPRRRSITICAGALSLLLACLSKENALTFVVIIPLAIWFFRTVQPKRLLAFSGPFLATFAVYILFRFAAVGSLSVAAPDPLNMMNNPFLVVAEGQQFVPLIAGSEVQVLEHPTSQSIVPMPAGQRLATIAFTWLQYLRLFAAPLELSYDYYPGQISVYSFENPIVLLSLLLHAVLLGWALLNVCRRRLAAFGILFYFLSFSIVSNLLFPVGTNMAERFLFMPSLGLCMALAALLAQLSERYRASIVLAGVAVIGVLFSVRSIARNRDWKDNFTLVQHDLGVAVSSAKIRSDYGEVVLARLEAHRHNVSPGESAARGAGELELLRSTLPLYKEALDVYPMYGIVWFNLARTNHLLGEADALSPNERLTFLHTAVAAYEIALVYKPRQYENDVGTMQSFCYAALGKLYGQQFGDAARAIHFLNKATVINPRNAYAKFLLGTAYDIAGNADSAEQYARAAYESDTSNRDYAENYAQILQKQAGARGPVMLPEAKRLLLEVARRNAVLPDTNPRKAAMTARTNALLEENSRLRSLRS